MSVFADKVHVYTSKMKKNGRYYIYGTGSMNTQNGVPDYRFEWNGRGILNAVNVGNADWLICKTNKYTSLWYNQ